MSNLLDKASIILTPTAYNNGEALCVKPSDGSGDFDFSRNSAATRVNAQGLVENVQILSSNLVQNGDFSEEGVEEVSNGSFSQEGAEQISNGSFDTDTKWTTNTGWSISGGSANCDGTQSGNTTLVQQNGIKGAIIDFVVGKTYKVNFDVIVTSGHIANVEVASGYDSSFINSSGNHTTYITAVSTNDRFTITANPDFIGSIDNVSVREVGQDWTLGTGWSIGEDVANYDGLQAYQQLRQGTVNGVIGKNYLVKYTVSDNNGVGGIQVKFGGVNLSSYNSSNGSFEFYVQAISTDYIRLTPELDFNGSITNISVKEVGQNWDLLNDVTSFSFNNGIANIQGTANSANNGIKQASISAVIGKTYKISATLRSNDGGLYRFRLLDGSYFDLGSGNSAEFETITSYHTATSTAFTIFATSWYTSGTANFDISNISIIEITDDTNLPRINYEGFSYQDALGSELVVNGDFSNGLTNWTTYGNTSVSNGVATIGASGNSGIYQAILNQNKSYKVTINVTAYNGVGQAQIANDNGFVLYTINGLGEQSFIFEHTIPQLNLIIRGLSNALFSIDNVSVKEYLGQEVVPDSGCGSWLFEPQSSNLLTYSSDYNNSVWVKTGSASVTYNTKIYPDGTQNSDTLNIFS
jgi:hypothetical protein